MCIFSKPQSLGWVPNELSLLLEQHSLKNIVQNISSLDLHFYPSVQGIRTLQYHVNH